MSRHRFELKNTLYIVLVLGLVCASLTITYNTGYSPFWGGKFTQPNGSPLLFILWAVALFFLYRFTKTLRANKQSVQIMRIGVFVAFTVLLLLGTGIARMKHVQNRCNKEFMEQTSTDPYLLGCDQTP